MQDILDHFLLRFQALTDIHDKVTREYVGLLAEEIFLTGKSPSTFNRTQFASTSDHKSAMRKYRATKQSISKIGTSKSGPKVAAIAWSLLPP